MSRFGNAKTYKYLGMHLDEKMNFKTHIEMVSVKLRNANFALFHLSKCAPPGIAKTVYFSLFQSYLDYCVTVCGELT